jgi:cytoskeleton protein RodZ
MNDAPLEQTPIREEQTAQADAVLPVAAVPAGQIIKDARLAAGLHIGTLSNSLKVPVKKLEALEAEDWVALPDVVFVRALATSVCRQIKIDSAPVLAALPQVPSYRAVADESEKVVLKQPFRSAADAKFSWSKLPISMPMVAGALALLLAAIVLIFLPSFSQQTATTKPTVPDTSAGAPIFPPATKLETVTPNLVSSSTLGAPSPVSPNAASVPAIAAPTSHPVAPAASGPVLRIASKGVVWVEVKDSKGAVLVQRTLQAKEVANITGQPPLAVVIGRINEIESITVRGKPLSTVGMSPDNVARFEVK